MAERTYMEILERFEEAWANEDWESLRASCHPDYQRHVGNTTTYDRDTMIELQQTVRAAFPDAELHTEDAFSDGTKVCVRQRMTGTQTGPFLGLPPTGNRIDIAVINIFEIKDGLVVENWEVADTLAMQNQLRGG